LSVYKVWVDTANIKKGKNKGVRDTRSRAKQGLLDKCYMRVHDLVVDVSDFQERHPGGNIIAQYHMVDATDAFDAFHGDSEYSYKLMR